MKTLIWNDHKQWAADLMGIFAALWGDDFLKRIIKKQIFPIIGNNDWFSDLFEKSKGPLMDLTSAIWKHWSFVRVYHACCPQNIEPYYSKGIVTPSLETLEDFILTSLNECGNSDNLTEVLMYMREHYSESDEKVFVAIDQEHLREFCTHHFMYGSEYLLSCGMLLGAMTGLQEVVLDRIKAIAGIPTMFSCDIPIEEIPKDALVELFSVLLAEGVRMIKNPDYAPPSRRFSFGVSRSIPPEWIVSHTHPSIPATSQLPSVWLDISQFNKPGRTFGTLISL